ncbi:hypothetical protein O7626_02225 [Micromonospora sp. WMMD1102]|uniref:hypothetical protein n=1 Tax=Micromonospora sp. WMMD1102 TaxID=3016105 RepID=UPI002415140F|nr:hypothetical protein [Micromonospora sp. WMMD1102]MDG4784758.1 hypothetical protein [Micromonospora sp. WMMD1102]
MSGGTDTAAGVRPRLDHRGGDDLRPYRLAVAEAELTDLRERLARTRRNRGRCRWC